MANILRESSKLRKNLPGWEWEHNTQEWEEDPRMQRFVDYWTSSDRPKIAGSVINEAVDLGPYSNIVQRATEQKLLIRACYEDIYTRVRLCREEGISGGVLLTGQPGAGKTLWLIYALVRLLQDNSEPFIFARGQSIWVFYNESVYFRRVAAPHNLPEQEERHLLALIDTDLSTSSPDPLLVDMISPVFPVHAASPDPSRYREWKKQRRGLMIGMPLWSVEELHAGISIQRGFRTFAAAVMSYLASGSCSSPSLLDSVQKQELNSTRVSDNGKTQEWATRVLLYMSVRESGSAVYGSSARDVYQGTFYSSEEQEGRLIACRQANAEVISRAYPSMNRESEPYELSHRLISLIVVRSSHPRRSDKFEFAFKSEYIAAYFKQKRDLFSFQDAQTLVGFCRFTPGGSDFSAYIYETLAHYILAGQPRTAKAVGQMFTMNAVKDSASTKFIWASRLPVAPDYDPFIVPQRAITNVNFGLANPLERFDDMENILCQLHRQTHWRTPSLWISSQAYV